MKKKPVHFNWKSIQNQAGDILGSEFWEDLVGIIPSFGPRLDAYETKNQIVIVVEIPGIDSPDLIQVKLKGNLLIIKGTIKRQYEVKEKDLFQSERFSGSFKREIYLPSAVNQHSISAHYVKGLLQVTLDKIDDVEEVSIDYHDDDRRRGADGSYSL